MNDFLDRFDETDAIESFLGDLMPEDAPPPPPPQAQAEEVLDPFAAPLLALGDLFETTNWRNSAAPSPAAAPDSEDRPVGQRSLGELFDNLNWANAPTGPAPVDPDIGREHSVAEALSDFCW